MKELQIYVHAENNKEPQIIPVDETSTVQDIINEYAKKFNTVPGEVNLFLQDEDDSKEKGKHADAAGIKKRSHVHCHRCRKITVTVFFNGDDKNIEVPPSFTAKNLIKKIFQIFSIDKNDATEYLLKLEDGTILQPDDHIGSFSSYPQCQVKIYLTDNKPIQG